MTTYVLQMRMIVNSKDAGFAPVGASAVRCAGWRWGPCVGARKPAGLGPNSPKVTDCSGLILHVVEDDAPVREALVLVLEGEGYAVRPWADGEQFLGEAQIAPQDLLLLDLELPGLGGAEVVQCLIARGQALRTVVLSGTRGRAFDRAVAAIAPVAALRKPLQPELLSTTLRRLCA